MSVTSVRLPGATSLDKAEAEIVQLAKRLTEECRLAFSDAGENA